MYERRNMTFSITLGKAVYISFIKFYLLKKLLFCIFGMGATRWQISDATYNL